MDGSLITIEIPHKEIPPFITTEDMTFYEYSIGRNDTFGLQCSHSFGFDFEQ